MRRRLTLNKRFQPTALEDGDEAFPNGIFEFNITRLLTFIGAHVERFPVEVIALTDIPEYCAAHFDEISVQKADLSQPILLAEIAPDRYNVIDGHHRIAKARRDGTPTLPAHRIRCPAHVRFLTSATAYESYVEYWNTKLQQLRRTERLDVDRRVPFTSGSILGDCER
jgi:hypothetical protein